MFVRQEVAGETARLAQPLCFAQMRVGLAKLCFARLQRGIGLCALDGDARDIGEPLDQLLFVDGRALGLAPVDGEYAEEDLLMAGHDGRRPARAESELHHPLRPAGRSPPRILGDIGCDDGCFRRDGERPGVLVGIDSPAIEKAAVTVREPRTCAYTELRSNRVDQQDADVTARGETFDQAAQLLEQRR